MPPLTMLITFPWNRPGARSWGTQAFNIMLKEPYPLRGYLDLHGWRKCQGCPDMMLMTLFFLCTADHRNCCDNCVCSEYPWHHLLFSAFLLVYPRALPGVKSSIQIFKLSSWLRKEHEEYHATHLWVYSAPIYS